jgi:hypothetical protein
MASLSLASCAHRPTSSDPWGAPIVVMTVKNGRAPFLVFALYSTGRLIRADQKDLRAAELITLSSGELRTLLRKLPLDRVGSAQPPVQTGFDGSTFCIVTWRDGQRRTDCVWGSPFSDEERKVPAHFDSIARTLLAAQGSKRVTFMTSASLAELWAVDSIEGCPLTGAPWPPDWPAIANAPRSSRGGHVVTLPSAAAAELERLAKGGACANLVESRERVYTFWLEPAWPHEERWYP